jgi:hypothetical protein
LHPTFLQLPHVEHFQHLGDKGQETRENNAGKLFMMDHSLENHKSYIGKPISELPTPSLVINLPVLKKNIDTLHRDVEKLGIGFRPHIKTLKVSYM